MLRQTLPYQLNREEIELYEKAVGSYPQSGGTGPISKLIYDGTYGMYIVDSPNATTMVIVSLNSHPDGTTDLFTVMLSGTGSIIDFEYCLKELKALAIANGCKRLTGMISASIWEKIGRHLGFETEEHIMVSFDLSNQKDEREQVESNGKIQDDSGVRASIHQGRRSVRDTEADVEQV